MNDEGLEVLYSTLEQVEKFEESGVWRDISAILNDRLKSKHADLESADDFETVRMIQGEINEIRYMLSLPDVLASEHKLRLEMKRGEKNAEAEE